MIANKERYNEIKEFVDDFNKQLQEAEKRVMENMNNNPNSENLPEVTKKKSKKFFAENIFKDPPSWKPPYFHGDYFEDFKRLQNKKQMSIWEIERVHMIPRSFIKAKELNGRDWSHPKYYGSEFGDNKNNRLSDLGKRILTSFIKDNTLKETLQKQKEEQLEKIRHSKPPLNINSWKNSLNQFEYFQKIDIDKVHSFISPKSKKFLVSDPFRRPKNDGDYFGKIVYDVNFENDKLKKEKLELKEKHKD